MSLPEATSKFKRTTARVILLGLFLTASAMAAEIDRAASVVILQKYCFDCHADGANKGQVSLDELLKAGKSIERGGEWLKAWKIVRQEFMPPAGKPIPTPDERKKLVNWMAAEMLGVDFKNPDPGRVTLRRLNRMEYDYSIQDLFGANLGAEQNYSSDVRESGSAVLKLRDRLPPDETAFGFDNIGDFLTLPPALLERYFEIAEFVAQRVFVFDGPRPPLRNLTAAGFANMKAADRKRLDQTASIDAPHAGKYRIEFQFTIGGWQEFGGTYDFNAIVDKAEIARETMDVGGYKTHRFTAEIELSAGKHTLALTTDAKKPNAKGDLGYLELRPEAKIIGPLDPKFAEYPEPHRRVFFKGDAPNDPIARRTYAREILERVASRAFRHPVGPETLDGLVELASRSNQFERGIAHAMTAILTSPKFLFRAEAQPQPNDPAVVHPLDDYALASRLSYLLWLSIPDDELTRLAGAGQLRQNLRAQVNRMLADPKSERFFEDFPGQWLRTRNVLMTPISGRAEGKVAPVRASMKKETEMLFEHIARNDRDLVELITANYTFLDKTLADFYGIANVPETGYHKITLPPDSKRGGILTHGSFLVSTSNPNRTSPVKRGLFVLENLFGIEPPPPPPNVPALDDVNIGDTARKTGRELLALHRADKSCAACHAHFDPIGIALEHYDLVGKWRDTENDLPIDSTETSVSGERLSGIADIQSLFSKRKEKLYRGITEKLLTYTLGRGLEPADSVTVDSIVDRMSADGGKFSTLLLGVMESPQFQMRRGDGGGSKFSQRNFVPPTPPPEKRRPPKRMKAEQPKPAPAEDVIPPDPVEKKPAENGK